MLEHLQFMVGQNHNLVGHLIISHIFPFEQNIQCVFYLVDNFWFWLDIGWCPTIILRPAGVQFSPSFCWDFWYAIKHSVHLFFLFPGSPSVSLLLTASTPSTTFHVALSASKLINLSTDDIPKTLSIKFSSNIVSINWIDLPSEAD